MLFGLFRNSSEYSRKQRTQRDEREWSGISFSPENFIPGLIIGFVFGLLIDLAKLPRNPRKICAALGKRKGGQQRLSSNGGGSTSDEELKMVLVVRQDLRMGPGKIASQCAHAATGMYAELMQSQRYILSQWEQCGQPKIVVSCKNQLDMNRLKNTAESIGLPTFIVADAGRTEVVAGSKTVLAIGPGRKASVDSVTGKLRLL